MDTIIVNTTQDSILYTMMQMEQTMDSMNVILSEGPSCFEYWMLGATLGMAVAAVVAIFVNIALSNCAKKQHIRELKLNRIQNEFLEVKKYGEKSGELGISKQTMLLGFNLNKKQHAKTIDMLSTLRANVEQYLCKYAEIIKFYLLPETIEVKENIRKFYNVQNEDISINQICDNVVIALFELHSLFLFLDKISIVEQNELKNEIEENLDSISFILLGDDFSVDDFAEFCKKNDYNFQTIINKIAYIVRLYVDRLKDVDGEILLYVRCILEVEINKKRKIEKELELVDKNPNKKKYIFTKK